VSGHAEKALADQLRRDPAGTAKLGQAASAIAHARDASALRRVVDAVDLRASPLLRRLEIVARSSCAVTERELIERTLARVARDQLDTLRPRLVAEVFASATAADRYLEQCVNEIRVHPIAEQVANGSRRIRAPRRSRSSTADLLYESLT
jgi:hypothetical protein